MSEDEYEDEYDPVTTPDESEGVVAIPVDLKWLRLGSGSVRHLCLSAESDQRVRTICGRSGVPQMKPFIISPGRRIDPSYFRECSYCVKVKTLLGSKDEDSPERSA